MKYDEQNLLTHCSNYIKYSHQQMQLVKSPVLWNFTPTIQNCWILFYYYCIISQTKPDKISPSHKEKEKYCPLIWSRLNINLWISLFWVLTITWARSMNEEEMCSNGSYITSDWYLPFHSHGGPHHNKWWNFSVGLW